MINDIEVKELLKERIKSIKKILKRIEISNNKKSISYWNGRKDETESLLLTLERKIRK